MSVETLQSRSPFPHRARYTRTFGQRLARFVCHLVTCLDVARQRRRLQSLDQRMLKDIGISSLDAHQEANRSFWDIPDELRRGR